MPHSKDRRSGPKTSKPANSAVTVTSSTPLPTKRSSKAIKYPLPLVRRCVCDSAFQDALYGPRIRLHNPCVSKSTKAKNSGLRCTVCSRQQE